MAFQSRFGPPGTIKAVSLAVPAMADLVGKELKGLDWWVSCGWVKVGLEPFFGHLFAVENIK